MIHVGVARVKYSPNPEVMISELVKSEISTSMPLLMMDESPKPDRFEHVHYDG